MVWFVGMIVWCCMVWRYGDKLVALWQVAVSSPCESADFSVDCIACIHAYCNAVLLHTVSANYALHTSLHGLPAQIFSSLASVGIFFSFIRHCQQSLLYSIVQWTLISNWKGRTVVPVWNECLLRACLQCILWCWWWWLYICRVSKYHGYDGYICDIWTFI